VTYIKFDHYFNFVPDDFLTNVVPHSQTHGNQRPCMDYVLGEIAASLIGK